MASDQGPYDPSYPKRPPPIVNRRQTKATKKIKKKAPQKRPGHVQDAGDT